jgi:hypothetical protein
MRTFPRMLVVGLLASVSQSGPGAGESYMSLVGQLYGGVELPRFAKDFCATAQPSTKADIAARYESWSKRNAPFLSRAREQFSRANVRLKSEGASLALLEQLAVEQLKNLDSQPFCGSYPQLLATKEKEFSSNLGRLLEVVEYADAELSKR